MIRKHSKHLISLLLVVAMLCGLAPVSKGQEAPRQPAVLQVGVVSDIHFIGYNQTDGYSDVAVKKLSNHGVEPLYSEAILESVLAGYAEHAKHNGMKYLLVLGDSTREGEREGHLGVAARLERFQRETGVRVLVVPGNHDINNYARSLTFENGKSRAGTPISPEQFREIYKELGYGLSNATYYTPPKGKKGGMLSYAVDLDEQYRLIALDTCKYSADQTGAGDDYMTSGMISKELLAWAENECREAVKAGKTVIGMGHHNLTVHFALEDRYFKDFMLDDFMPVSETLAQAGMHYFLSGHIHQGENGVSVADDGSVLYDICTGSLIAYPSTFLEVRFATQDKNNIAADVRTFEADCVKPVVFNGTTFPSPFSKSSFALTYSETGIKGFIPGVVQVGVAYLDMLEDGGIGAFIGDAIDTALGGGIRLGPIDILTGKNIVNVLAPVMGLINDIYSQLYDLYLKDPDATAQLVADILDQLIDLSVSTYPSTQFIKSYGIGGKAKPGTFGDLISEALIYAYGRAPGAEKNKFYMDATKGFEEGDSTKLVLDVILDVLLRDLIENEILKNIKLNIAPVFVLPVLEKTLGAMLDGILRLLLMVDNSFAALVDAAFKLVDFLNILPYSSLDNAVDSLLEDYWTPSLKEGVGYQLGKLLRHMAIDQNDVPDLNGVLRYTGPRKVVPTQEDRRLPTMLSQALPVGGENFDRKFSWFSRYSVTGTDIRVWDASGRDITDTLDITRSTKEVKRNVPGIDLGIFSFLDAEMPLVRHTVTIEGLQPLQAYSYQVGDAKKGWWSPKSSIFGTGDVDTTFLSFTDQQSQTPHQYARSWGKLSEAALNKYPAAAFILSAGDHVVNSTNSDQWECFFNSAQKTMRRLPIMPSVGESDTGEGILDYFPIGKKYYSFDYNNIHVIVLDTEDLLLNYLSAAQVIWLKADIRASKADWNIIVMHKSLYSNGIHFQDKDVAAMRSQLTRLFSQLGIDIVIGGHDHTYSRTTVGGVKYVTAGTSGVDCGTAVDPALTDAVFPRAEAITDAQKPVFAAYHAQGGTLAYEAYQMEAGGGLTQIDSFTITKGNLNQGR